MEISFYSQNKNQIEISLRTHINRISPKELEIIKHKFISIETKANIQWLSQKPM